MDNDIIRIAEAMGWIRTKGHTEYPMSGKCPFETWSQWGGKVYDYLPFNPKTSHADCHALIEWLRAEKNCPVRVEYTLLNNRDLVEIWIDGNYYARSIDDYRLGIVDLTLKLLEKEDG